MSVFLSKDTHNKQAFIRDVLSSWDASIDVEHIVFLSGGSHSIAVRAGEFVFRFPLTEDVFKSMKREAELTVILNKHLPFKVASKIPIVSCVDASENDAFPFSYHHYIYGKIMDNIRGETSFNTCYCNLTEKQRECLASDIAFFLSELHSVPTDVFSDAIPLGEDWNFTEKIDEEKSRKMLLKQSGGLLDLSDFKTLISQDIVLCHNDLSGSNFLILPENENILTGVVDFANAKLCSRTNDFIPLYKIGRDLVCRTVRFYNQYSGIHIDIRELDYKVLCFIGFLLERQKKPSLFITALIENFLKNFS